MAAARRDSGEIMLHCNRRSTALLIACCRYANATGILKVTVQPRKARTMTTDPAKAYRRWLKYREIYKQLMLMSDRDLTDIGVKRGDIPTIARKGCDL